MPELSESQRRKLAELEPRFAEMRLVDAFERKWEIGFRCLACGTSKTWRRDAMLGKARALLGHSMAEIQRRTPCPRCGRRMPQMFMHGVWDPAHLADQYRREAVNALLEVGLSPHEYGYGWRSTGRSR